MNENLHEQSFVKWYEIIQIIIGIAIWANVNIETHIGIFRVNDCFACVALNRVVPVEFFGHCLRTNHTVSTVFIT